MTSKDKNFELNDKELERVSGGDDDSGCDMIPVYCYCCNQSSFIQISKVFNGGFTCPKCKQFSKY